MAEQTSQLTRLYLVRHGQSVANVTWEFSYRRVDPPLTDLGIQQAQITAEHLPQVRFPPPWEVPAEAPE